MKARFRREIILGDKKVVKEFEVEDPVPSVANEQLRLLVNSYQLNKEEPEEPNND